MRPFSFLAAFFIFIACALPTAAFGQMDLQQFSSANGLEYHFDSVSWIVRIWGPSTNLRFHVGSEYALDQGRLVKLGEKTVLKNGSVLASWPVSAPARHFIRKIAVDAGHGGNDAGAISPYGLREKRVVLDVARRLKQALEARGFEVAMTRNSDIFIPLAQRAVLANRSGADFFVSIHANASLTRSLQGFEVYYLSEATDDSALAVERAENSVIRFESVNAQALDRNSKTIVWDLQEAENRKESLRVSEQIVRAVSGSVVTAARRVRTANFYVLKWTECPAVLVELGYLTNKSDERRLRDPMYKDGLVEALVHGIWNYKTEYEATDGFTK